ncbi:MAG: CopG family transcriptional regulator [Terriglobia bacterium]
MWYMKTAVYSWRLSPEIGEDLEREARARGVSVAAVLRVAVRDWLKTSGTEDATEETQRRLDTAVGRCLGVLAGGHSRRAETAREGIRQAFRAALCSLTPSLTRAQSRRCLTGLTAGTSRASRPSIRFGYRC